MSLLFNTLSRFVIAFLPRRNSLLISWLQSSSAVILEPKKRKSVTTSTFSLSICHEVMGLDAMFLVCLIFNLKPTLSLSSFTSPRGSLVPASIQVWFPLILTDLISLMSKGPSEVFSSTTVQRHEFFGILPSLWPHFHNFTWPLGRQ